MKKLTQILIFILTSNTLFSQVSIDNLVSYYQNINMDAEVSFMEALCSVNSQEDVIKYQNDILYINYNVCGEIFVSINDPNPVNYDFSVSSEVDTAAALFSPPVLSSLASEDFLFLMYSYKKFDVNYELYEFYTTIFKIDLSSSNYNVTSTNLIDIRGIEFVLNNNELIILGDAYLNNINTSIISSEIRFLDMNLNLNWSDQIVQSYNDNNNPKDLLLNSEGDLIIFLQIGESSTSVNYICKIGYENQEANILITQEIQPLNLPIMTIKNTYIHDDYIYALGKNWQFNNSDAQRISIYKFDNNLNLVQEGDLNIGKEEEPKFLTFTKDNGLIVSGEIKDVYNDNTDPDFSAFFNSMVMFGEDDTEFENLFFLKLSNNFDLEWILLHDGGEDILRNVFLNNDEIMVSSNYQSMISDDQVGITNEHFNIKIVGCTDEIASNYYSDFYNPIANYDIGTCMYNQSLWSEIMANNVQLNDSINFLNSNLNILSDNISNIQSELSQAYNYNGTLTDSINLLNENISSSYDTIDILNSNLNSANNNIIDIQSELNITSEDLNNANLYIMELVDSLTLSSNINIDLEEQLATALENVIQPIYIDLPEGWSMFGFTKQNPEDLVEATSCITDLIIIAKDYNGAAYLPEFGFNGIGSLEPGLGYQIKLTEFVSDFNFCD